MYETVNLAPYGLRRFESCPTHIDGMGKLCYISISSSRGQKNGGFMELSLGITYETLVDGEIVQIQIGSDGTVHIRGARVVVVDHDFDPSEMEFPGHKTNNYLSTCIRRYQKNIYSSTGVVMNSGYDGWRGGIHPQITFSTDSGELVAKAGQEDGTHVVLNTFSPKGRKARS